MAVLEVIDVAKSFGGIRAVDGCSLRIREGGITGLIGPNGAGKTTLFNIITGFTSPDAGQVLLDGQDITGWPPHRLYHQGLMRTFQIPHEFSRMSCRENLMMVPAGQAGEGLFSAWFRWGTVQRQEARLRARADEVLDFLNLSHVRDELAGNLSGGQKKLLELGRVMMGEAKLLLLDEPGAGVNRTLLAELCERIEQLNTQHGYTIIIIEHDMDVVAKLCDPVFVLAQGKVLAQGPMASIRANPAVIEAYLGGGAAGQAGMATPSLLKNQKG